VAHIRGGEGPSEEEFERFLHGEQVDRSVRPVILRSWRRCQAVACTPEKLGFPDPVEIDQNAFLVRAARPILDRVHHVVENADAALLLVDDQARLVLRYLSDPGMRRYFDKVGAVPGTTYAESAVGTNGTGTALRERRLTRVAGFEHPATCVQPFTGTGVPILDPLTGHALGVVSIVCPNERDDPAMSILVQQVAERIERRLLEQSSERERDLFETYLRAGGLPGPPPAEGAGHVLRELPRGDRFLLEEKAVGLIALGRRGGHRDPPLPRANRHAARCPDDRAHRSHRVGHPRRGRRGHPGRRRRRAGADPGRPMGAAHRRPGPRGGRPGERATTRALAGRERRRR
jgi:hypothetical protein